MSLLIIFQVSCVFTDANLCSWSCLPHVLSLLMTTDLHFFMCVCVCVCVRAFPSECSSQLTMWPLLFDA